MSRPQVDIISRHIYEVAAREYLKSLPLEHFMESTPTATQREITVASLRLLTRRRPDVHVYNECLVQYPIGNGPRDIGRVVPDNMVVVHDGPLDVVGSYNLPHQPVGPFLTLEYVSEGNERKDYNDNMRRYERDLRVPYYLLFEPHKNLLSLYRLNSRRKYSSVRPTDGERYPLPELDLEVGLLDDWVRYWYRRKLLPITGELEDKLEASEKALRRSERRANAAEHKQAELEAELARMKAELDRLRGTG